MGSVANVSRSLLVDIRKSPIELEMKPSFENSHLRSSRVPLHFTILHLRDLLTL